MTLYCASCNQRVTGPCTEPVDMGGGMIDRPCDIRSYDPAHISKEGPNARDIAAAEKLVRESGSLPEREE